MESKLSSVHLPLSLPRWLGGGPGSGVSAGHLCSPPRGQVMGNNSRPCLCPPMRRWSGLQLRSQGAPPFEAPEQFGWAKQRPSGQCLRLIFASGLRSTYGRRKLSQEDVEKGSQEIMALGHPVLLLHSNPRPPHPVPERKVGKEWPNSAQQPCGSGVSVCCPPPKMTSYAYSTRSIASCVGC